MSDALSAYLTTLEARFRVMLDAHYEFIWRLLRRFGVPESVVDDAAQEVFWVAARRFEDIKDGSERAFLYSTAKRIAAEVRRRLGRRREDLVTQPVEQAPPSGRTPEDLVDAQQARAVLDEVLASMDDDLREVLILFELENMEVKVIAQLLKLPVGTVGSRLRRAREAFAAAANRMRSRLGLQAENRA